MKTGTRCILYGHNLRLMRSHTDGVVSSVESDELRLEHDVAVDLEVGGGGLETSEASYRNR